MANGLRAWGIERGDRVALFLPNIPAFAMAYFAVQKAGGIAVSINSLFKTDTAGFAPATSAPPTMRGTFEDIIEFCRDRIATFKAPREVKFVAGLPKSATGKILKRVLGEESGD